MNKSYKLLKPFPHTKAGSILKMVNETQYLLITDTKEDVFLDAYIVETDHDFFEEVAPEPPPLGVSLEMMFEIMDEPIFPCLFVPIDVFQKGIAYQYEKAFITECKIRTAGHYFKIKSCKESKLINYSPTTEASFDGPKISKFEMDEMGQFSHHKEKFQSAKPPPQKERIEVFGNHITSDGITLVVGISRPIPVGKWPPIKAAIERTLNDDFAWTDELVKQYAATALNWTIQDMEYFKEKNIR